MTNPANQRPKYKRILLKLSGEALQGDKGYGIDPETCSRIAGEVKDVVDLGVQTSIVVGGGNIFRGLQASKSGFDRTTADYMGMLATILNGMAIQEALEQAGVETRVQTAIEIKELAEPFIRRRAISHLERDIVVIFVGGTGNPYFSTDTTAALRASEINADVIFKATKVDGVFSDDPVNNPKAQKFDELNYIEVIQRKLKVMDMTAINVPGNIRRIVLGETIGTIIREV